MSKPLPYAMPVFDNVDDHRRHLKQRLAAAFREAAESGDAQALARLLAEDAVLYTDGGGKRAAAFNEADPLWATVFCMALLGSIGLLVLVAIGVIGIGLYALLLRILPKQGVRLEAAFEAILASEVSETSLEPMRAVAALRARTWMPYSPGGRYSVP